MLSFEKIKNFTNNFFQKVEVNTINFGIKKITFWKLKYKLLLKSDNISTDFKKKAKLYWKPYTKKFKWHWHKYYSSRNENEDVKYIPDDLYYTVIDQHFNNRKYGWGVNDKNYYDLWFPNTRHPMTVIRKINGFFYDKNYRLITREKAIEICLNNTHLIIKPAVETGGSKGIVFWKNLYGEGVLKKHFNSLENLIVQQIIEQHRFLENIHPSSINTIRVMSLLFQGKVHPISSVLRMGVDGSNVDNASVGGITCGIKENGQLKENAYSARGIKYKKHPQGFIFNKGVVPSFDKVIELVSKEHEKMAHFRLISWDIAVDKNGEPILIEANLRNGEIDFHQFNNGPLFGELTDDVLDEVFGEKRSKKNEHSYFGS